MTRLLAVLIGLLLLSTGVSKALELPGFIGIVGTYRVLPPLLHAPAAVALVVVELGPGSWLLSGWGLRAAGLCGVALHGAYLAWAAAALARGLEIANCGCFGVFWPRPLGLGTLAEDAALIVLCAAVAWRGTRWRLRGAAVATALLAAAPAQAVTLDGITLPGSVQAAGATLRLNGAAVRTYSVFRVHVYVAGLYLTKPERDAASVMASAAPKLLAVHYLRAIDGDDVHAAWRALFAANCSAPCAVPAAQVQRFLALSPAIRAGDAISYLLTPSGTRVVANGRTLGDITGPDFARLLLATFIGAQPTSEALKRALLGG